MNKTHDTSSSDPKDTEVNEYLLLREVKIKRNQERLKELGLIVVTQKTPPCSLVSSSSSSSSYSSLTRTACPDPAIKTTLLPTTTTTTTTTVATAAAAATTTTTTTTRRRSKRLNKASFSSSSPQNNNNNNNNTNNNTTTNNNTASRQEVEVSTQSNHKKQKKTIPSSPSSTTSTSSKPPIIKPGSSRSITLDVQKVLCGPYCHYPVFVGRTLSCTGKAAVLAHAHDMSCIGGGGDPKQQQQQQDAISFNKYSGACEFQNDVIFLWVNMHTPDSNVKNEFVLIKREKDEEEEQVQMTWFGGSKMRIDSPTIQRLLDIGKRASKGDLSDSCGIVLWYRLYDVSKKKFQPYSCLGRLGYHCHHDDDDDDESGSSHPVKIIFNLLDYKYLKVAKGPHGSLSLWDEILQMQKVS